MAARRDPRPPKVGVRSASYQLVPIRPQTRSTGKYSSIRGRSPGGSSAKNAFGGSLAEHESGAYDHAKKLWALIQLELWLRTFVDVKPVAPIAVDLAAI